MSLTTRAVIGIYTSAALLTFGYSATNSTSCKPLSTFDKTACAASGAAMSAMLWPLYWTWEAFERQQVAR